MMLSPQDAAGALRDIEAAQARSAKLHGYARSSPQLLLWGVLWAIGYGLKDFFPAHPGGLWGPVGPNGRGAGFSALRWAGDKDCLGQGREARPVDSIFSAAFFGRLPINPE